MISSPQKRGESMSDEITVLIADDHPIFRKGLREIITAEPSLKLVAEVEDGAHALLHFALQHKADL
jgi:two-component system, NarL family, response regulator DegU